MNNCTQNFLLRAICVLTFSLGIPMTGGATVPDILPVQGVLSDSEGDPLDGTYGMRFSIYDSQDAESALWSDDFIGIDVDAGFFTVYLGTDLALDFTSLISNEQLWLGVQVADDEEMERILLASVPFAMESQVCQSVGSLTEETINDTFISTETQLTTLLDDNYASASHSHDNLQTMITDTCEEGSAIRVVASDGTVTCETFFSTETQLTTLLDDDYAPATHTHNDLQTLVSDSCPEGSAIRAIAADGTVTCEEDDNTNTTYTAGVGLALLDTEFNVVPSDFLAPITKSTGASYLISTDPQSPTTVDSISFTAPADGTLLVSAYGTAHFSELSATKTTNRLSYSIATSAGIYAVSGDGAASVSAAYGGYSDEHLSRMYTAAVYDVTAGETVTRYFQTYAVESDLVVRGPSMHVVFMPN